MYILSVNEKNNTIEVDTSNFNIEVDKISEAISSVLIWYSGGEVSEEIARGVVDDVFENGYSLPAKGKDNQFDEIFMWVIGATVVQKAFIHDKKVFTHDEVDAMSSDVLKILNQFGIKTDKMSNLWTGLV